MKIESDWTFEWVGDLCRVNMGSFCIGGCNHETSIPKAWPKAAQDEARLVIHANRELGEDETRYGDRIVRMVGTNGLDVVTEDGLSIVVTTATHERLAFYEKHRPLAENEWLDKIAGVVKIETRNNNREARWVTRSGSMSSWFSRDEWERLRNSAPPHIVAYLDKMRPRKPERISKSRLANVFYGDNDLAQDALVRVRDAVLANDREIREWGEKYGE